MYETLRSIYLKTKEYIKILRVYTHDNVLVEELKDKESIRKYVDDFGDHHVDNFQLLHNASIFELTFSD